MSKLRVLSLFIGALALIFAGVGVQTAYAAPTDLIISEYIEGSSNNKAIEIFNGTGASVDLGAGLYRLELYSNGSATVSQFIALTGVIADGDVLVLSHASANATILAVTDITSSTVINFTGNDAIVLRKNGASGPVVDSIGQVGFNPGSEWGTGVVSTGENTLQRINSVCAGDTNPSDIFDPSIEWNGFAQNTSTGLGAHSVSCGDTAPYVITTTPTTGASNVVVTSDVVVTFSEPVNVTAGSVSLTCSSGTPVAIPFTITTSMPASSITFEPVSGFPSTLSPVTTCTMTLPLASVADVDGSTNDNMTSDYTFSFDIEVPALPGALRIHDIQSAIHISPELNNTVTNVPGIVTALATNGFWLQDPQPDADNATSEGIFVFTGSAPTVNIGDAVLVSGVVRERFGQTQIGGTNDGVIPDGTFASAPASPGATTVTIATWSCSGDCAVDVVRVGNANVTADIACGASITRQRPFNIIDDDSLATYDSVNDGMDFWESLEGMRVCMHNLIAIGPNASFNEFWILPDNGAGATALNSRGGLTISSGDMNAESIHIDDTLFNGVSGQPVSGAYPASVDVGSSIAGAVQGVIGYSFGDFEFLVNQPFTLTPSTLAKETTTLVGNGTTDFTFATYNVENLAGNASTVAFNERADQICNNLQKPDIVMLQEIQDNNGTVNDAIVDSTTTLTNLINAIATKCGVNYAFSFINPSDDQDGGAPGGNIRVAFIYRTDRPVNLVAGAIGGATDNTTVTCTAGVPTLNYTLGRILPGDSAFNSSRKPLVGQFDVNGVNMFLINLHMNSKGGDDPLWGFSQPPVLSSEVQRNQQATVIRDFIQDILDCDPFANIIVAGDYNDFQFSTPVTTVVGTTPALTVMNTTLATAERYSYNYKGNAQSLDHISISPNLFNNATPVYDTVHVNSEFISQVSDHDPSVLFIQLPSLNANAQAQAIGLTSNDVNNPQILNTTVNVLDVTFTIDVKNGTPANSDHADNPANYILLTEGTVAGFQTTGTNTCATGGAKAGDTAITFTVTFNTSTNTATLNITGSSPFPPLTAGKYSLIICGSTSIVDTFGRALNNGEDVQYYFDIVINNNGGGENNGGGNTNNGGTTTTVLTQQQIESGAVTGLPATGETPVWADNLRTGLAIGGVILLALGLGLFFFRRKTSTR